MKTLLKKLLIPVLYRKIIPGLQPERLYIYMDEVWKRRKLNGSIIEVGCHIGGTAAFVFKMLERTGNKKEYLCIDTFGGFVDSQFAHDVELGTHQNFKDKFSSNSIKLVRKILDQWKCNEIKLIQNDIVKMETDLLPNKISVCLMDVDLDIPTYEGIKKIYPRLETGGIIIVDDCPENYSWAGARIGYERFMKEHNLETNYINGLGIIEKQ